MGNETARLKAEGLIRLIVSIHKLNATAQQIQVFLRCDLDDWQLSSQLNVVLVGSTFDVDGLILNVMYSFPVFFRG